MTQRRKATATLAVVGVIALPLAGCGGGGGGSTTSSSGAAAGAPGGTLYYLYNAQPEHLDPQRIYLGRDIAALGRLTYRSLVQFPVSTDVKEANTPKPDLATDTGKSEDGGKKWSFTLKDGVKWQDGKDVTCEDLKYGMSRTFATDVITGGPNYILNYLDVPTDPATKLPTYVGPYKKTGQAAFDKAVTCNGKTITYNFKKAWPDFPLAIASLRSFDPYRADQDKGDASNFAIFANGPYKVEAPYTQGKGVTFVRNDQYDAKTDGIRKALPDKITIQVGVKTEVAIERLINNSGNDQYAVTDRRIPPSMFSRVNDSMKDRTSNPTSPYVDYLVPNFKRMTNPKVREALAVATDKAAYMAAQGGDKAMIIGTSVVAPSIVGYKENPVFKDLKPNGDPEAAKKLLAEAGVTTPVAIKYTYQSTATQDKAARVLKEGWDKAGFNTTLDPLTDTYYAVIQNPANASDVMWGGWGADWPSMSTVIPALFDSRINITPNNTGQDYGNYASDAANSAMDKAMTETDVNKQADGLQKVDELIGKDYAYIPLGVQKFNWIWGSKVTGYIDNPAMSMYPDLASIGVQK